VIQDGRVTPKRGRDLDLPHVTGERIDSPLPTRLSLVAAATLLIDVLADPIATIAQGLRQLVRVRPSPDYS